MSFSRTVRIFLSSTFRDFAEERDLLVRKVFPELRRKCRERQVELVDVDLRWGITEQEAQQGKVLPICLAEIDRSRPYFMGAIGERYGWVPEKDQYNRSLVLEQPWLDEHRGGKSVTELEMLHGVLNDPAMKNRAFFYFRDPKWAKKKGGHYLSEGPAEKAKVDALKDRIRRSGFPVVEGYRNPEALAEKVREDLWKLIDEAYPESDVPDALTLERRRHETYSTSRLGLYLGGEKYFEVLDEAMNAKAFRPVLITGPSGAGKSALIANWVSDWAKRHPKAAVIVHHLGAGEDAADPVKMAVRVMQEIARLTGDEFDVENDPQKQLEKLPQWLAQASAWARRNRREVLIVLDGLDKLSGHKHLRWLPGFLPPKIKLVASCLGGEVLETAKGKLRWRELSVKPLTKTEQKRFISAYLGRYRKSLTPRQAGTLQDHPLSGNPLFLLTVLEELRVFGVHEELEGRLRVLLSPPPSKANAEEPAVDDVFEHVLARIEADLGRRRVQPAMEAIWASRGGLFNDELLAIANLAPAQWAAVRNSLDESLYETGGLINFGHDHLRKAVEDRYGLSGRRKLNLHSRLARWFAAQEADSRVAEELPWQWQHAGRERKLRECLTSQKIFLLIKNQDPYGLIHYWLEIPAASVLAHYRAAWERWSREAPDPAAVALELAEFLIDAGHYGRFTRELLLLCFRRTKRRRDLLDAQALRCAELLAFLYRESADYDKAERLYHRCLRASRELFGPEDLRALVVLRNLSVVYRERGQLREAEPVYRSVVELTQNSLGAEHIETFRSKANLAGLLLQSGDLDGSEKLWAEALAGFRMILGERHPTTLKACYGMAYLLLSKKRFAAAERYCKTAVDGLERSLGPVHPETLRSIGNLGLVFLTSGKFRSAEPWCLRAMRGLDMCLGADHPDTLRAVQMLGEVFVGKGRASEAEREFDRAYRGLRHALSPEHPATIESLLSLSELYRTTQRSAESVRLLREYSTRSPECLRAVRWCLARYECLEGNTEDAKRLIRQEVAAAPEKREQALKDADLVAIRDYVRSL